MFAARFANLILWHRKLGIMTMAAKKKTAGSKKAPKTKAGATKKATAKPKAKAAVTAKAEPKKKATPKAKAASKPSTARAASPKKKAAARKTKAASKETTFTPYTRKKDEGYMNEEQKQHFRDILLAWKVELMEEVDRTVNHMQEEASNYPDPADRASQEEEFSLELKTRDRERRLIRKIDSTLELIDLDDYGYCESCGVDIGVGRLEARPTATLCIDCKTLAEIREKQIRG
jgi:DnaK suppressor protein